MSNDIYKSRYSGQEQEVLFNKINNLDVDELSGVQLNRYSVGDPNVLNRTIVFTTTKSYNIGDHITVRDIYEGFGYLVSGSRNFNPDLLSHSPCLFNVDSVTNPQIIYLAWLSNVDEDTEIPTLRGEVLYLNGADLTVLGTPT